MSSNKDFLMFLLNVKRKIKQVEDTISMYELKLLDDLKADDDADKTDQNFIEW